MNTLAETASYAYIVKKEFSKSYFLVRGPILGRSLLRPNLLVPIYVKYVTNISQICHTWLHITSSVTDWVPVETYEIHFRCQGWNFHSYISLFESNILLERFVGRNVNLFCNQSWFNHEIFSLAFLPITMAHCVFFGGLDVKPDNL